MQVFGNFTGTVFSSGTYSDNGDVFLCLTQNTCTFTVPEGQTVYIKSHNFGTVNPTAHNLYLDNFENLHLGGV